MSSFTDIAFHLEKDIIFIIKDGKISAHSYSDFKPLKSYPTDSTPFKIFYSSDTLYTISKAGTKLGIEVVNLNTDPFYTDRSRKEVEAVKNELVGANDQYLNVDIKDTVFHPRLSVIYIADSTGKKLYQYDYASKKLDFIPFEYSPESLYIVNNKLYMSLLKNDRNSRSESYVSGGSIVTVDTSTFKVIGQFDVPTDPVDIVVDNSDKFVYVLSRDHEMISYSLSNKQEVSTSSYLYYGKIDMNSANNKIYTVDIGLSPVDYHAFNVKDGIFQGSGYDSPYHGDYRISGLHLSPDGKYIFSKSGEVFLCSDQKEKDLIYHTKLNKSFLDIAFHTEQNRIFTAVTGGFVYSYKYDTFEGVNTYKLKADASYIFYRENKIVAIEKVTDPDLMGEYKYLLEVIPVGQ